MTPKTLAAGRTSETAVVVGAILVLLSWVSAAAVDAYFQGAPFLVQLLHPQRGDLVLRLLFMALLLAFILYISPTIRQSRGQRGLLGNASEQTEAERLRSLEILESVGEAISIQDTDLKVIYQNQAHKNLMGSHVGEYCYRAYQHKEEACGGCHLAESYQDGKTHKREVRAMTNQGLKFTEIISTPLRDPSGKIVAGIEAVRDVTDRKRAELEVQRMNRELELRALELADANRELEAFSYSLSHDLRSYITRISTAQQVLELKGLAKDRDARYLLQTIEEGCRGMEHLIDAMLTLSLLSRQEMRLEQLSFSELAREVLLQLQQQEPERQVELAVESGVTVEADRGLLKVALENLIGNAWKYTRDAPKPRIEVGVTESGGRRCYFVRDNGTGFDMKERDKLFRPFERLKSAEGFPGSGVGLATVQRAISRHGGEVWAEAEPGKGAIFYFTLGGSAAATEPERARDGAPETTN